MDRELQEEYLLKVVATDGAWRAETTVGITVQVIYREIERYVNNNDGCLKITFLYVLFIIWIFHHISNSIIGINNHIFNCIGILYSLTKTKKNIIQTVVGK